jgi:hypothetical protein
MMAMASPAIYAQEQREQMAQKLEEMFPAPAKPPAEMKCPPQREAFTPVLRAFMDRQNVCLRAGRPFYLKAKQRLRICREPTVQCRREAQMNFVVDEGKWLTVLKRMQGVVYVEYDATPFATERPHELERGYVDQTLLQAPQIGDW